MRRAVTAPPELPGFEYEKLLGSGGFADVFLYKQRLPRRDVAVKVLLVDEIDSESRGRFVAEANVMAQLSTHPYIVTIYHADIADGTRPYFVMEYCPGPSLADRYKSRPLEVPDALRTGIRVGSAVAAAHAQGILHRDIKPANVLTNGFGWPALTDFGIASTLEGEVPMHTTSIAKASETNASVGLSVPWSPPEMFQDDPDPDVRSDVFSLAATIHTVLAGRTPFEVPGKSNGTLDIIGRIERGAITPIARTDIPRSLTAVLAKGMAPRRADRYQTVVDFVRALQRVELELGYSPTGIDLPNLGAHELERPAEGGADETRMRPIQAVEAQPRVAPKPIAAPPPAASVAPVPAEIDPTRLRGVVPLIEGAPGTSAPPMAETVMRPKRVTSETDASPAAPETQTPGAEPPKSKRNTVLLAVTGGIVVVGIAIALIAVFSPHDNPTPKPTANVTDGGGGLPVQVVPDPKPATRPTTVSSDGKHVTFRWVNPAPQKGDQYQWYVDATNIDIQTTAQTQATVAVTPGQQTCVVVRIKRSGKVSSNPLRECTG
jgi:serine/threonine protein kinase